MIKFQTFLEAKNTTFYIDHNGKKQVVNLSGYKKEGDGNFVTLNDKKERHSFNDMPAEIELHFNKGFFWFKNGKVHRNNSLPSEIFHTEIHWSVNDRSHRTNGPAEIYFDVNDSAFYLRGHEVSEEQFVETYQDNILLRIKEHPKDIQWYKVPNFKLQKTALDLNFSVKELIERFHPDLAKTKHAHLLTSRNAGLLDD